MKIDVAAVYEDLKKVSAVGLNIDPKVSTISPAYLQEKTLECELHASKVERHELKTRQGLDTAEHMLRVEQENFNIKHRAALIHNKTIKELPTGKEREAAVDELLEDERKRIVDLEDKVSILKNLAGAIKTVHSGISRKDGRVKVLMRLMDQQLNRLNVGLPDDPEVSELTRGLAEVEKLEDEMTIDDVESSTVYQEPEDSGDEFGTGHPQNGTPETNSQEDSVEAPDIISAFFEDDDSDGSPSTDADVSESEENESFPETAQSEEEVDTPHETGTVAESTEAVSLEEDSGGLNIGDIEIDRDETDSTSDEESSEPTSDSLPDINVESVVEEASSQEVQTKEEVAVSTETPTSSSSGEGIDIDALLATFD